MRANFYLQTQRLSLLQHDNGQERSKSEETPLSTVTNDERRIILRHAKGISGEAK